MERFCHCRRVLLATIAAAILWPAAPAAPQRVFTDAASDLKHGFNDVIGVWTAPARMRTSDLEGLAVVVGIGGALLLVDGSIQDWVDTHPASAPVEALEPFRIGEPGEVLGDIWYTFRYGAAAWVIGLAIDSPTMREASMGCLAAGVAQTVPRRLVFYESVYRTRPAYTDDPYDMGVPGGRSWPHRSFPGGHAANAFTCVSFLAQRYSMGVLEPLLYAAATGVAAARVADGAHWASDSWFGAALGFAIGRAVALRARDRAGSDEAGAAAPSPPRGLTLDLDTRGLQLGYTWRF